MSRRRTKLPSPPKRKTPLTPLPAELRRSKKDARAAGEYGRDAEGNALSKWGRLKKGNTKYEVNVATLTAMANCGATDQEIADWFGVPKSVIAAPRFKYILDHARANMKVAIRRAQLRTALGSKRDRYGRQVVPADSRLLIHLGKTVLQQRETTVLETRELPKVVIE
jgi:hypothetical protein